MDSAKELLFQSGDTLLGIIVGGVIVVIGQLAFARGTRLAAEENARASLEVAEIRNQTALLELRLKQTELLLDRQLERSRQFLDKLEAWDAATRDISNLGHDEGKIPPRFFDGYIGMQLWEARKILRDMRLVLPSAVTDEAQAALDAGIGALEEHETNFYTKGEDNKDRRADTEDVRNRALESFSQMQDKFLGALQKHIHLESTD